MQSECLSSALPSPYLYPCGHHGGTSEHWDAYIFICMLLLQTEGPICQSHLSLQRSTGWFSLVAETVPRFSHNRLTWLRRGTITRSRDKRRQLPLTCGGALTPSHANSQPRPSDPTPARKAPQTQTTIGHPRGWEIAPRRGRQRSELRKEVMVL